MTPPGLDQPLRFAPVYQVLVWGGRRMSAFRSDLPEGPVGESWELSDQRRGVSVVAEGPLAGKGLDELCAAHPEDLVGQGYQGQGFPLLVKLIDANDRLSVQVHPDDALAQSLGIGARGKTECWYLIGDGGELYQGTAAGVDKARFEKALAEGGVERCLNRFMTHDGDFFFMPARTVHALGRGCLLFEVQQSCDCTFRVYDWGRVGLDGKPRPVHVQESLATIDFSLDKHGPISSVPLPIPGGGLRRRLVECPYFTVEERRGSVIQGPELGVCTVVCVISGSGSIRTEAGSLRFGPMQTILVPAAAGAWQARAQSHDLRLVLSRPAL